MELKDMMFAVTVIEGHWSMADQYSQNYLSYEGLSWEDAVELMKLSFVQGHEVVISREEEEA